MTGGAVRSNTDVDGNPFFSVYLMSVSLIARRSAQGQKATFSNALTKARFGMKSGSLHKADLPDW